MIRNLTDDLQRKLLPDLPLAAFFRVLSLPVVVVLLLREDSVDDKALVAGVGKPVFDSVRTFA